MKEIWRRVWMAPCLAAFVAALCLSGCESSDDDEFDHTPPDGMGSLILDNKSADDVLVYVDGLYQGETESEAAFVSDLSPGLYRVVVFERIDGRQAFTGDIDILSGRLTILTMTGNRTSGYSATTRFE